MPERTYRPCAAYALGNGGLLGSAELIPATALTEILNRLGSIDLNQEGGDGVFSANAMTVFNEDPKPIFVVDGLPASDLFLKKAHGDIE